MTPADTGTGQPTFEAVVMHVLGERAVGKTTHVVLGPTDVKAEEVAAESLLDPDTELGLNENVLPLHRATLEVPRIPGHGNVDGGTSARAELEREVHRRGDVRQQVGFEVPGRKAPPFGFPFGVPLFGLSHRCHRRKAEQHEQNLVIEFHSFTFFMLVGFAFPLSGRPITHCVP